MTSYIIMVLIIYIYMVDLTMIYHIYYNKTPYPNSIKRFIKLTFLPYVIYKIIKKEDF